MIKRIIVTTLVVILVGATGVAAYDAYQGNSTLDLSTDDLFATGQSQGQGQGQGQGNGSQGQGQGRGQGQGQQGRGQGQGGGQGQGAGMSQSVEHDWVTLTGTVLSAGPQSLTVDTVEQGELTLELGMPGFASEQGIVFNPGDEVAITGFDENGMFQAGQIDNKTTGESLLLRDPNGRPLWAGRGQGQGQGSGQGQGQGGSQAQPQGQRRGGQGQGQRGGAQGQGGQANQSGQPQATDRDWVTLTGAIVSGTDQNLTVETDEMGQLTVQLGPPGFASQQNVAFNAGDLVTLIGFSGENDTFQAGQITNDTTSQILMLRDPNGRPLWAGRGQGGGGGAGQSQNQGQSF